MGSVTISASYGSHGERIGRAVGERLGLEFVDRAIPNTVAQQLHLSEETAESFDERAPSRWERLFGSIAEVDPPISAHSSTESLRLAGSELRDTTDTMVAFDPAANFAMLPTGVGRDPNEFRLATERTLRHLADGAGAVILGRCAMVVLADRADVLRVRLDGPLQARIANRVSAGIDEATARRAQKHIDGAREQYARYFYKTSQDDPRLYHVVLDSLALSLECCVDVIVRAAEARFPLIE